MLPFDAEPFVLSLLSKDINVRIIKTLILPVVLYGCETWSLTVRELYLYILDFCEYFSPVHMFLGNQLLMIIMHILLYFQIGNINGFQKTPQSQQTRWISKDNIK
jgi:hypothetical protein